VTFCVALVSPTPMGPKSSTRGETRRWFTNSRGLPVPSKSTENEPPLVDTWEVAVKVPAAVGANW